MLSTTPDPCINTCQRLARIHVRKVCLFLCLYSRYTTRLFNLKRPINVLQCNAYICLRFAIPFTIAAAIFEAMKMVTSSSQHKQTRAAAHCIVVDHSSKFSYLHFCFLDAFIISRLKHGFLLFL